MCGFAGLWTREGASGDELASQVDRMAGTLVHRGPDDSGRWVDPNVGVALGFRRLAILDLTPMGHQPMTSTSGRYTIVFNGEIYNFSDIRRTLEANGTAFRGRSDTEVMLAAIEHWGLARALSLFIGMFAFALWDAHDRSLTLVRDRLGIKPLYYAHCGRGILFGSELRALRAHPSFDPELDRDAVAAFLRYLYVPAPWTIYSSARKLPPGTLLTIRDPAAPLPPPVAYWSLVDVAAAGIASPFEGSEEEAVDELEARIREAVALRLQADVPLGTFLSGGIDSSLVTALAQTQSSRPVRTFSIAFAEQDYNEAHHAAEVARYLGTDHVELPFTAQDALRVVPLMADVFDEPHADTSQLPAYMLCAAARQHVTVSLTGDGGDEVFGGYNRYQYTRGTLEILQRVPPLVRRGMASAIVAVPSSMWDVALRALGPALPGRLRVRQPGDKLGKLARLMSAPSLAEAYRTLVSGMLDPERLVVGARPREGVFETTLRGTEPVDILSRMLLADQLAYLPDDQLTKVDRVSMAVGLEARVPLLDHRVVEWSWRLGGRFKVRDGVGKWALRQVLYRHVPRGLVERQKMGLSLPVGQWLRGPLREWAETLLDPSALSRGELLRARPVRTAWEGVLSGRNEDALGIWAILMLQAWRQRVGA